MTIVVVDDDDDIRELVCEVLHDEGYNTAAAANGKEAIELLRKTVEHPQLILLDLMMPVMDGWECLLGIDKDPVLHRIPVALMSAHPNLQRLTERTTNGPLRVLLPKPLDLARLLSVVEDVCKQSRA